MGKGVRLKGLKRVVDRKTGRVYLYRRVRGKHVALPDLPENHPEFLAAYLAAEEVVARDGSLSSLIETFIASRDFKARKSTTQVVWRRRLDAMRAAYGTAPAAKITEEHINKALRKLTPGAARSERTIWRAIFAFAVQEGWRTDNPARHTVIGKMKATPHPTWTQEEIQQFRDFWPIDSGARQAFEVIYWTGARCVDAAKIGWQGVNNGILEFVQEKTGGVAVIPITAPVPKYLEADQRLFLQAASNEMLFILSSHGKGRTVKSLSQLVAKAAREAGIEGKTAHGLRKARAIFLAEHSWTPNEIGAWTGHESLKEIAHYTRDANKRAMIMGKRLGKLDPQDLQVIDKKADS